MSPQLLLGDAYFVQGYDRNQFSNKAGRGDMAKLSPFFLGRRSIETAHTKHVAVVIRLQCWLACL